MGKTPIVSATYEKLGGKDFIKKQLISLNCVSSLSCVVHGPMYGRFMGFY